ncbi:MAG: TIR domain-containing protein [Phycisphaerales bacterium]
MSDQERRFRYDAFISYRHVEPDRRWAKWLHGALETYRVPRELVKQGFPARLTRVFRDEDELPANADLSTQITTALDESKFLIVVCSPRAPASRWVNAEVEHFRRLGRHDRILALLIEGEPRESFPPALTEIRRTVIDTSAGGAATEREQIEEVEPLAADVRPTRSDTRAHVLRGHARLRIMACILGCRFDDLRQREAERRVRRARQIGAALAVLVLIMGALAAYAFAQRAEADRQRRSAQAYGGLIADDLVQSAVDAQDHQLADTLSRASRRVSERFKDQPALMVEVSVTLGDALLRAGNPREALDLFERVRDATKHARVDPAARLALQNGLADARLRQSISDADLADARLRLAEATAARGARDPLVMTLRNQFAGLLKNAPGADAERAARLDEAEREYAAVLADRTAVLGAKDLDTLVTRHNLGIVDLKRCRDAFNALGKDPAAAPAEARAAARRRFSIALEARRSLTSDSRAALGPTHPQTLATWSEEVALRAEAGRLDPPLLDAALNEYPAMLDELRRSLGFDHWRTLEVTGRYAQALGWAGRTDDAERAWWLVIEGSRTALGEGYWLTLGAADQLAALYERRGEDGHAEMVLLDRYRDAVSSGDAPLAARRADVLRSFFERRGRTIEAAAWAREAEAHAGKQPAN